METSENLTLPGMDVYKGALKHDYGKLRWDLLPLGAVHEVVRVYTFGATKYEDWNWARGLKYSRCLAAILRHLYAYMWRMEKNDPESNCHHMACVVFYCLALIHYDAVPTVGELDDRRGQWVY